MLKRLFVDINLTLLSGAMDFNWFPGLLNPDNVDNMANNNSWKGFFGIIANTMYNIFYVLGIFFFGYKIIKALYYYNTRSVHEIQKNQMGYEIAEPIIGLLLFSVGIPILTIIINSIFPGMDLSFFGINLSIFGI